MEFGLSDDQKLFKRTFADFSDEVVAPGAAERDEKEEFDLDCWKKMADLGLAGLIVPEEYGGTNAGALIYAMALKRFLATVLLWGLLCQHTHRFAPGQYYIWAMKNKNADFYLV